MNEGPIGARYPRVSTRYFQLAAARRLFSLQAKRRLLLEKGEKEGNLQ